MPGFRITLDDGRKLRIDADSEAAAAGAALQWSRDNPAQKYSPLAAEAEGFLKGASFNWRDEIRGASVASGLPEALGGFRAPVGAAKMAYEHFTRPEGERPTRQKYEEARDEARRRETAMAAQQPVAFGAGQFAGGVGSTLATAGLGQAVGLAGRTAPTFLGRVGQATGAGAAQGAIAGAGETEGGDALDLAYGTGLGGLTGGALGFSLPVLASTFVSPFASMLSSRINPQGYGERQVARALVESGHTPADIDRELAAAVREGQDVYTPADVMGLSGQRMLSTVARAPGEGRQMVSDFLEGRQAGQSRRVASQLSEGFGERRTAQQVQRDMEEARDTRADVEFEAGRQNAGAVNVRPVIQQIDATLQPGVNQIARPPSGIADDPIEAQLQGIRRLLTDDRSVLSDYRAVERIRRVVADKVNSAHQRGEGNLARVLRGVRDALDRQMEQASQGFRQANRNFAQASRNIEAIEQGRTAARRGRPEDTIPAFQALTPEGQQGFRAGYIDPLIEQVAGAPVGVNKARQFTSEAFGREAGVMAPGAQRMGRQLERENVMAETRQQALGGSRTADNLADAEAMGVDPTMIGHALRGDVMGLLRAAMAGAARGVTGNTPAVRRAVAELLLARNVPQGEFQRLLDRTVQSIVNAQRTAQVLTRAGAIMTAGAAVDALGNPQDLLGP